jgi:hypothetical protein
MYSALCSKQLTFASVETFQENHFELHPVLNRSLVLQMDHALPTPGMKPSDGEDTVNISVTTTLDHNDSGK